MVNEKNLPRLGPAWLTKAPEKVARLSTPSMVERFARRPSLSRSSPSLRRALFCAGLLALPLLPAALLALAVVSVRNTSLDDAALAGNVKTMFESIDAGG